MWHGSVLLAAIAAIGPGAVGCGQTGGKEGEAKDTNQAHPGRVAEKAKGDDHSGWWCPEHGVPEAVCGQCSPKAAAEFKKKGDWCDRHDRPDSQCFICHPELKEKFAALYRAKYGKEPPPTEDDAPQKGNR